MDYFETNLISNKHDMFIYPLRWLIFCVIFFSIPWLLFVLLTMFFETKGNLFSVIKQPLIYLTFGLLISATLKFISSKFFRKGVLYISKDQIKTITKDGITSIPFSKIEKVLFERRSNFHKDEFHFNVKREHGNKLKIWGKDNEFEEHEFQISSRSKSQEYDRLINVLVGKYGSMVNYTSV